MPCHSSLVAQGLEYLSDFLWAIQPNLHPSEDGSEKRSKAAEAKMMKQFKNTLDPTVYCSPRPAALALPESLSEMNPRPTQLCRPDLHISKTPGGLCAQDVRSATLGDTLISLPPL